MSKPKKWIEAATIEQIEPGMRVRMVEGAKDPMEFTVLSTFGEDVDAVTAHWFLFDVRDRRWFVRNPEWVKPKGRGELRRALAHSENEARILAHELDKLRDELAAVKAASLHDGHGYDEDEPEPEPVMPEEPPVGSFFRVDRTGHSYFKDGDPALQYIRLNTADSFPQNWDSIAQPGDTITLLELTEVGEK